MGPRFSGHRSKPTTTTLLSQWLPSHPSHLLRCIRASMQSRGHHLVSVIARARLLLTEETRWLMKIWTPLVTLCFAWAQWKARDLDRINLSHSILILNMSNQHTIKVLKRSIKVLKRSIKMLNMTKNSKKSSNSLFKMLKMLVEACTLWMCLSSLTSLMKVFSDLKIRKTHSKSTTK